MLKQISFKVHDYLYIPLLPDFRINSHEQATTANFPNSEPLYRNGQLKLRLHGSASCAVPSPKDYSEPNITGALRHHIL